MIAPEQARKILAAHNANLVRKLQSGLVLTSREVRAFEAVASGNGNRIRTKLGLARALQISRPTLDAWLAKPGNPGRSQDGLFDVDAWREWAEANGLGRHNTPAMRAAKARQTLLQNQKLEYQIDLLRREYVPTVEVEKWGAELKAQIKNVVGQLRLLAPSLAGLRVGEIEDRLSEMENEILSRLHLLSGAGSVDAPKMPQDAPEPSNVQGIDRDASNAGQP